MSRTVRRLILDYQLLWIGLDLILTALLGVMDWGWLFSVRNTAVVQWFVPVFCVFSAMLFAPKMPVWQALPVSPSDRRRAQWWLWIGLPLIRAIVCMVLPLLVLTPLKGVHATPTQIASVLELQLLALLLMGGLFSASTALRRRFGLASGGLLTVPLFLVGVIFSPFQLTGVTQLVLGGVAVLAGVAATYVWTDRIASTAAAFAEERQPRPAALARSRVRGWATLAPYACSGVILAVAAAVAVNYSMVRMLGPNIPSAAERVLPSQMLMTVILLSAIGGQAAPYAVRALRALPVGPAALTAVLQGFMLVIVLAPVGVLWALMRATDLETSRAPIYLVSLVPMVALRLPINFRVGVQPGAFLSILPALAIVFLPTAGWTRTAWFDAAMILVAAAVWMWTWWELAYGRAAYRVRPLGVTRWRGGFN